MFREAIIPQVNDGKPFEAYGAREVPSNSMGVCLKTSTHQISFIPVDSIEDLEATRASITFQLDKALNPPIEVTDAVLKAMEKVPEAKFSILNKDFYIVTSRYGSLPIFKDRVDNKWFYYYDGLIELKIGDYVQADCPLALQVLLGFTQTVYLMGQTFDACDVKAV